MNRTPSLPERGHSGQNTPFSGIFRTISFQIKGRSEQKKHERWKLKSTVGKQRYSCQQDLRIKVDVPHNACNVVFTLGKLHFGYPNLRNSTKPPANGTFGRPFLYCKTQSGSADAPEKWKSVNPGWAHGVFHIRFLSESNFDWYRTDLQPQSQTEACGNFTFFSSQSVWKKKLYFLSLAPWKPFLLYFMCPSTLGIWYDIQSITSMKYCDSTRGIMMNRDWSSIILLRHCTHLPKY